MPLNKGDSRLLYDFPPCVHCVHLVKVGKQSGENWTCQAFPNGIPPEIVRRKAKHDKPFTFQEGEYVFESKVVSFDGEPHKVTFEGEWVKV